MLSLIKHYKVHKTNLHDSNYISYAISYIIIGYRLLFIIIKLYLQSKKVTYNNIIMIWKIILL
jgi:hypothetical protein